MLINKRVKLSYSTIFFFLLGPLASISKGSNSQTDQRIIVTKPHISSRRVGFDPQKIAKHRQKVTMDVWHDIGHKVIENDYLIGEIEGKGLSKEALQRIVNYAAAEFKKECEMWGHWKGSYFSKEKDYRHVVYLNCSASGFSSQPVITIVNCLNSIDKDHISYLFWSSRSSSTSLIFYDFLQKYLNQGYTDYVIESSIKNDNKKDIAICKQVFNDIKSSKIHYANTLHDLRTIRNKYNESITFRIPPLVTANDNLVIKIANTPLFVEKYRNESMKDGNFNKLVTAGIIKDENRMYKTISPQCEYLVKIVKAIYNPGSMLYNGKSNEAYVRSLIMKYLPNETSFVKTVTCYKYLDNDQIILQPFIKGISGLEFYRQYNKLTAKNSTLDSEKKEKLKKIEKIISKKVEELSKKLLSGSYLGIKFTDHGPTKMGNFMISHPVLINRNGINIKSLSPSSLPNLDKLSVIAIDLQADHGGGKLNVKLNGYADNSKKEMIPII